ncbi:MAG: PDC sensor domain-containing protein [Gammaproteobacteria bacterium]
MTGLKNTVAHKKALLGRILAEPMQSVADAAVEAWDDAARLDACLQAGRARLPHCHLVYALDTSGTQLSANVGREQVETRWRGQNLAQRPYLEGSLPYQGFILSPAYLSARNQEPCLTALQAVRDGDRLLGFIAADFNIHELPELEAPAGAERGWQQFKGDPAIRGTLFLQQRSYSHMDEHIDAVLAIMHALMRNHGVFHGKLHFSSSRLTVWHVDDPFNYRIHGGEEIASPDVCLAYPQRGYPRRARVDAERIPAVLSRFRALRNADDTIYLRAGSLNIINGMVGLTFSCDGSHYMRADEFLDRDLEFWMGAPAARDAAS